MIMTGTMSILGLYQWDKTLFDLMSLPEGLEKENLIATILSECADLEILFPNPEVMKGLIAVWSQTQMYEWTKLYKTMLLEYNPIDNYDRTETRTLNSSAAGNSADGGTDKTTGNSSTINQVKAFDTPANTFTDREKDTVNNSSGVTYGHTNVNSYNKNDNETIRAHGNIGVTTTQQMIDQERKTAEFNIYNVIANEFKQRYCLLVY